MIIINKIQTFFLAVLLLFPAGLSAQWVSANGLGGGEPTSVAINKTTLFAGTGFGGILVSSDSAKNWSLINN